MTAPPAVEHLHDRRTGQHLTFLETGRDTDGELLTVQVRLEPGGAVPRHAHLRQDEQLTVCVGTISVHVRVLFALSGLSRPLRRRPPGGRTRNECSSSRSATSPSA